MAAKTEVSELIEAARRLRESIEDVLAKRAAAVAAGLGTDTDRLDKLQAVADRKGCGWHLDRGRPAMKHHSQEAAFETIREAIDAMEDEPDAA